MLRPILSGIALGLTVACAPVPTIEPNSPGAQTALFASYPDPLLQAAFAACSAPGQTPRRPDSDTVICETLPSPEAAAALILAHNGTVLDLPSYIIGFQAAAVTGGGYVVTADNYIRVPQDGGGIAQVRPRDPLVEQTMRDLLNAAGGAAF